MMRRRKTRGQGQGQGQGQGRGLGRQGGSKAAGVGGQCICPKCGHKTVHKAGQPCFEQKCPKCGEKMLRE